MMEQIGYNAVRRRMRGGAEAATPCLPLDGTRDEILRRHLPLVRRVVQRRAARKPPDIETDGLVSAGRVGLGDAVAKYGAKQAPPCSTYAQCRICSATHPH